MAHSQDSPDTASSQAVLARVLGYIEATSGLGSHRHFGGRLRSILFAGFNAAWLRRNQKFDVSYSSPGMDRWRFSISDFGEKGAFPGKIRRAFSLFGDRYRMHTLEAILAAALPTRGLHQTTFGIDWERGCDYPRLKIYFEELRHRYSRRARARLLRRICSAAGLEDPLSGCRSDLAAVCIDFLPNQRLALKTYLYEDWDRAADGDGPFRDFVRTVSRERRAFFYRTLRCDDSGRRKSCKLYKVYEARQIRDFSAARLETYEAIRRWGRVEDVAGIERHRRRAVREGALWYPVLCALDVASAGARRIDAYYSLR